MKGRIVRTEGLRVAAAEAGMLDRQALADTTGYCALLAQDVEVVEYYQRGASIPAIYDRTGSACGVRVIWLRR